MSAQGLQIIQGQPPVGLQQALAIFTPAQIVTALREGGIDITLNAQPATNNAPQAVLNNPVTATINPQHGQGRARGRKFNRNKPRIIVPPPGRPTRPLNSFIAYRSYYSVIFVSLQQKEISGFLTFLWKSDPFKAKWTLLAKAYSIIRDQLGRVDSPLDKFLTINAPFIGIVAPENYLALLGWEISMSEEGEYNLSRQFTPNMASFAADVLSTHQTVHDIIQNSYDKGYIPADGGAFWLYLPARAAQNIMATNVPRFPPFSNAFSQAAAPQVTIPAPAANANSVQLVANQNSAPAAGQNFNLMQSTAIAGTSSVTGQPFNPIQPTVNTGNSSVASQNANSVQPTETADKSITTVPDSIVAQANIGANDSIASPKQSTDNASQSTEITPAMGENGDDGLTDLERQMLAGIMAELDEIDRKEQERKQKLEDERKSVPGHDITKKFNEANIPFPYNGHFTPDGAPDITLDPYEGERFDQYNINDLIHSEMFE